MALCKILQDSNMSDADVVSCGSGDSFLIHNFLDKDQADATLAAIDASIVYLDRQDHRMQFHIYGKTVSLPRDKAVFGEIKHDEEKKERVEPFYRYAKDTPPVEDWKGTILQSVQQDIQTRMGQECNHVVVNQYRNGNDYIGFHHDKDKTFVAASSVLTISLGGSRILRLRKVKGDAIGTTKDLKLCHGSLFVLGPKTNREWKHSIIKRSKVQHRRVSLTYRSIAARRRTAL